MFLKIESSLGALQSPLSVNQTRRDVQRDRTERPSETSDIKRTNSQGTAAILQGSPEVIKRADTFHKQQAEFEPTGLISKTAINSYQSIAKEQQKGELQLLMGVDTYV